MTEKSNNKNNKSKQEYNTKNVLFGVIYFLGILSIIYSTVMIVLGTNGIVPIIMVIPQGLIAVHIGLKKFCK